MSAPAEYHPCFLGACRGTIRVVAGVSKIGERCRITRLADGREVAVAWACNLCVGIHSRISNPTLAFTLATAGAGASK